MKKYKIIGIIPLCFVFNDEPHDILLSSESGYLETDGSTVWLVDNDGEKFESTTTANIIEVGVKEKSLEIIN
jgi:hypothetical protein